VANFAKTPQILCAILLNNHLIPPSETESHEVADQVRDEVYPLFGVEALAKSIRNPQAMAFLDWFKYSENTIDGQSRKKAYTLWESNLVADKDVGKVQLKALEKMKNIIS